MRWLAYLLCGEPVLRLRGPVCRDVLYSGQTILPLDALVFPRSFVLSAIWVFDWGLMPGCLWSGCGVGGSRWECQPAWFQVQTFNYLPCLQPHFLLLPPSYLLAQSPEPSGVAGQIGPRFLLAFQQAVWLPAPFRLPCGVFWVAAFSVWLIHQHNSICFLNSRNLLDFSFTGEFPPSLSFCC